MKKVRTLLQCLQDPRVTGHNDERGPGRDPGDGIWLHLNRPWWCPDTDQAMVHEWNVRDLCNSLNSCYEAPNRWDELDELDGRKLN